MAPSGVFLDSWGARYKMQTTQPLLVYRMLQPISCLVLRGACSTLTYPAPRALKAGPPQSALFVGTNVKDIDDACVEHLFAPESLHKDMSTIADSIRQWSSHVVQAGCVLHYICHSLYVFVLRIAIMYFVIGMHVIC